LQVIVEPGAFNAVTQIQLAFTGCKEGIIAGVNDFDVELGWSACAELRFSAYSATRAPTICLWLVWMKTQLSMGVYKPAGKNG